MYINIHTYMYIIYNLFNLKYFFKFNLYVRKQTMSMLKNVCIYS